MERADVNALTVAFVIVFGALLLLMLNVRSHENRLDDLEHQSPKVVATAGPK